MWQTYVQTFHKKPEGEVWGGGETWSQVCEGIYPCFKKKSTLFPAYSDSVTEQLFHWLERIFLFVHRGLLVFWTKTDLTDACLHRLGLKRQYFCKDQNTSFTQSMLEIES